MRRRRPRRRNVVPRRTRFRRARRASRTAMAWAVVLMLKAVKWGKADRVCTTGASSRECRAVLMKVSIRTCRAANGRTCRAASIRTHRICSVRTCKTEGSRTYMSSAACRRETCARCRECNHKACTGSPGCRTCNQCIRCSKRRTPTSMEVPRAPTALIARTSKTTCTIPLCP